MEILIHEILLFTASWIIRDIRMDSRELFELFRAPPVI